MPTYSYACPKCQNHFDRRLALSDRDIAQACSCGEIGAKILSTPTFVLQGDGWTGKNIKIQNQMKAKNRRLGGKSKDLPTQKMVPNVGGEETGTWLEAKHLAAAKGMKDTSSYDAAVRKEKLV